MFVVINSHQRIFNSTLIILLKPGYSSVGFPLNSSNIWLWNRFKLIPISQLQQKGLLLMDAKHLDVLHRNTYFDYQFYIAPSRCKLLNESKYHPNSMYYPTHEYTNRASNQCNWSHLNDLDKTQEVKDNRRGQNPLE